MLTATKRVEPALFESYATLSSEPKVLQRAATDRRP